MPKKCIAQAKKRNGGKELNHDMTMWNNDIWMFSKDFKYGEGNLKEEVTLTAGVTYKLDLDMHFEDPEVPKDFSVVAQGATGGAITITHWKGQKSAAWPVITKKGASSTTTDTTGGTATGGGATGGGATGGGATGGGATGGGAATGEDEYGDEYGEEYGDEYGDYYDEEY